MNTEMQYDSRDFDFDYAAGNYHIDDDMLVGQNRHYGEFVTGDNQLARADTSGGLQLLKIDEIGQHEFEYFDPKENRHVQAQVITGIRIVLSF